MKLQIEGNFFQRIFALKRIIYFAKIGALKNLRYHKIGRCNICGNFTIFICTDLVTARNNMFCLFCHSSSRKRHVAQVILKEVVKQNCSLSKISKIKNIKIYNTDINDAFYRVLYSYDQYICSGFFPNIEPGQQIRSRVFCQDIEHTTFNDKTFNLVITEDVFEHIRDYKKGFREIFRILKVGGYHIFTVPCYFDKPTLVRVDTSGDKDIHVLLPEYHGDAIRGRILAYRTFGIDIFDLLKHMGFDTKVNFSKYADQKYGIFDSYTFISKKLG
jgi:SAM-dependent methyltransferase